MRKVFLIAVFLCSAINCFSQAPKHATKAGETKNQQQPAASTPNQTTAVHEQPSGNENDETATRHKEEIEIQRQLSKFTGWLVAVGFLQFIVLAVQAVLFFQQKKIMGQHKTSLEDLAGAAKTSAGEAVVGAKFTRETIKDSERAQVYLYLAQIKRPPSDHFDDHVWLELVIKNFGRTRAINVSGEFKFDPAMPMINAKANVREVHTILGAGQEHTVVFDRFANILDPTTFQRVLTGQRPLSFVGQFTYDDIFGGTYTTQCTGRFNDKSLCFVIEENRAEWEKPSNLPKNSSTCPINYFCNPSKGLTFVRRKTWTRRN
jgi:hypothetical protein